NHWVIIFGASDVNNSGHLPPYLECVAISSNADPIGAYYTYVFDVSTVEGLLPSPAFNDYDKIGVWPDAYYVTWNAFWDPQHLAGAAACALDCTNMLVGNTPRPAICFIKPTEFSLLPSDLDGDS